jgi:hypothetical protein
MKSGALRLFLMWFLTAFEYIRDRLLLAVMMNRRAHPPARQRTGPPRDRSRYQGPGQVPHGVSIRESARLRG